MNSKRKGADKNGFLKIVIHDIPPSNNKYLGNSNSHFKYHQDKERWHFMVKAALKEKPEIPYQFSDVSIVYFFPDNRRRDPDNYSGKFILDPLVREGIIADDSFEHISLKISKGGVDKSMPRTEITVEENMLKNLQIGFGSDQNG